MLEGHDRDEKHILVVEDEEDVASLLKARLEANGYDVAVEGRGCDAVDAARARRPHLVILDLMLPDMNGFQVSRELRQLYDPREVRILILTAIGLPQARQLGRGVGADAYVRKPYDAQELLGTVARLLDDAA